MKILLVLLTLSLMSCSENGTNSVTASGAIDLNVNDNLSSCRVRVNGTTVFVQQTGLDPFIIALDGSFIGNVTYPDVFNDLSVTDAQRITNLTPLEVDIINGIQ